MFYSSRMTSHTNYAKVIFCLAFLLSACGGEEGGNQESQSSIQLDRTVAVMGIDTTQSGSRDDIKALITRIGPPEQQNALKQVAKAYQDAIIKNGTQEEAIASANAIDRALGCLHSKSTDYQDQSRILLAATANTEARFMASHYTQVTHR